MFLLFASAFVVGLSGAMMPGPVLTYTIRKSLSEGPRAGFIIIAGHAFLELLLVIVIFLGFDMVLQSKQAQVGIGLVGGILLAYMGIGMIRSSMKNKLAIQMDSDKSGSGSMAVYGLVSIIVGNTRRFIKEKPYRIIIVVLGAMLIIFGIRFFYGAFDQIV